MIRASITVDKADQLINAYNTINQSDKESLCFVRILNQLNTPNSNVLVNFIYDRQIIGELEL